MNVILQMVTALVVVLLLAQLWLFTVTLDAMENLSVSINVVVVTMLCSLLCSAAVWVLIRFFLRAERIGGGS